MTYRVPHDAGKLTERSLGRQRYADFYTANAAGPYMYLPGQQNNRRSGSESPRSAAVRVRLQIKMTGRSDLAFSLTNSMSEVSAPPGTSAAPVSAADARATTVPDAKLSRPVDVDVRARLHQKMTERVLSLDGKGDHEPPAGAGGVAAAAAADIRARLNEAAQGYEIS